MLQTRACLEELMQSDEDMLGLLLTEAKELRNGEVIKIARTAVTVSAATTSAYMPIPHRT